MKKLFSLLIVGIFATSCIILPCSKTNIINSTNLVGVWGQVVETRSGQDVYTGVIKVINSDNTFYLIWNSRNNPQIGLYGTYTLNGAKGSYTEHIMFHSLDHQLNGTDSELKYELIDENTLLLEFHLKKNGYMGREVWRRITPLKTSFRR